MASWALTFSGDLVLTFALVLQGFVRASLMTILILTLMELPVVQERHAGTASGLFFSAAEIGGVLGPLVVPPIEQAHPAAIGRCLDPRHRNPDRKRDGRLDGLG